MWSTFVLWLNESSAAQPGWGILLAAPSTWPTSLHRLHRLTGPSESVLNPQVEKGASTLAVYEEIHVLIVAWELFVGPPLKESLLVQGLGLRYWGSLGLGGWGLLLGDDVLDACCTPVGPRN